MKGIEETKDALKFIIGFGEAIDKSLEDGKIGYADLFNFAPVMMDAGAAFSGIDQVPGELKDLSKEERDELVKFVEEEFDIDNDNLEILIEKSFKAILSLYGVVEEFKK